VRYIVGDKINFTNGYYSKEGAIYESDGFEFFKDALDYAFLALRASPECEEVMVHHGQAPKANLVIKKNKILLVNREGDTLAVNERKIKKFFKEGGKVYND
jgi:hypothetical protein